MDGPAQLHPSLPATAICRQVKNHPASFLFGLNCQIRSAYCADSKFPCFGVKIYIFAIAKGFWSQSAPSLLSILGCFSTQRLGRRPHRWHFPPILAPSGDRSWCNHTAYVTHSTIIIWRGVPTSPNLFIALCLGYSKVSAGHMWRLLLRLEAAQGDPLTTARLLE